MTHPRGFTKTKWTRTGESAVGRDRSGQPCLLWHRARIRPRKWSSRGSATFGYRVRWGESQGYVADIELDSGEDPLTSAVIDTATGYAFFGTGNEGEPGKVVKVKARKR